MIELERDKLFLSDGKGGEVNADTKALRQRLICAFEACDMQKGWLADSLTEIVEGKIRSCCQRGEPLTPAEVENLLTDVLKGSGLGDVAEAFLTVNPEQHTRESAEREPASSSLLNVPTRYITADKWQAEIPESCSILMERKIIRLMPVSDLLPVAVVECRPARLHDFSTPPNADVSLEEQLGDLCRRIVPLLAAMKARIVREWPDGRSPDAHIRFTGMPAFLQLSANGSSNRKTLNLLRQQSTAIIRKEVNACADFTISISYS